MAFDTTDLSLAEAWVEDFESLVYHLGQQEMSRLRNAVRNRTGTGDIYNFERLAKQDMTEKTVRNAAAVDNSPDSSRRTAQVETWNWMAAVDHSDLVRILIDPESEYLISAGAAMGRRVDAITSTAAVGAAVSKSPLSAPASVDLPAGQILVSGTGKLTVDLLREAKRKLDEAEVGVMQGGERYCAINAKGLQDLLEVTEVASYDYNSVKALVQGEVDTFLGFNFIRTEILPGNDTSGITIPLPTNGTGTTETDMICWERSSVALAISDDRFTRVAEDPSINFSTRVYCELTMGSVRIEDEGVVAIEIAK